MRFMCTTIFIFSVSGYGYSSTNNDYNYNSNQVNGDIFKDNSEISSYDGNLSFKIDDVVLPGNGGLDIKIGRRYDLHSTGAGLMARYKASSEWVPLGVGWKMTGLLRVWHSNDYWFDQLADVNYDPSDLVRLCNEANFLSDDFYIDLPDGTTERLFKVQDKYQAKTKSNWVVSCSIGNVTVKSPNGETYLMGNIDKDTYVGYEVLHSAPFIGYPGEDFGVMGYLPDNSYTFMTVKEVTDSNGNWLKYDYKYHGNKYRSLHPNGIPQRGGLGGGELDYSIKGGALLLSKIYSSDQRVLDFEYDPVTGKLLKISNQDGRGVLYSHKKLKNPDNHPYESNITALTAVEKIGTSDKTLYDYYDISNYSSLEIRTAEFVDYYTEFQSGRLSKITFPEGGSISYSYEKFNYPRKPLYGSSSWVDQHAGYRGVRLKEKKLSTGETWTYSYLREKGKLNETRIQGPLGLEINKFFGIPYIYSLTEDLLWKVGSPAEKILTNGDKIVYEWQPSYLMTGQQEMIIEDGIKDNKNNIINRAVMTKKIITRDGADYITEYKNYDEYGKAKQILETGPNNESRTTNINYINDINKWILSKPKDISIYNGVDLVSKTIYTYDTNGNLLSINKDGVIDINTYDTQGNIATSVNANGATTSYSNYKLGIAQTEVQPEGVTLTRLIDNSGNIISETNGLGHKTSHTYDGLNRITSITPPIGDKTTISYTASTKSLTQGNLIEVTNFDSFGRIKDVTRGDIKTSYTYDAFDNKIFESNPNMTIGTTFTYDALNRIKTILNPENTKQIYEYGRANTSITDERGKKTTYNYRAYGDPEDKQLMSIVAPIANANITLTRNGRDQITSVKQGNLTRNYGYNAKYQLTSVTNPETGMTILGRDNVGNMTSIKVGNAAATTLSYDGRNRNTQITYPGGIASVIKTYTKTDKLDSVSNTATTRKYTYDANDNLKTEALIIDDKTFTTTYAYNGKNQLSTITYPQSGSVIDYSPDALGRPTKVGSYITNINYWPSGQFKQLNYANGTVSNYGQNTRLWPSSFDTKKGTTIHLNSGYSYDSVGNLLGIVDSIDSSFNRTSTYDEINRLITAQGSWGTGIITYDGIGNITKQSFGPQILDYVYNTTTNRLDSTTGIKVGTYSYDVLGNIISDGTDTYNYNSVPSLICAKCNSSTKRTDYAYDGLNKRVSVNKGGEKRYEVISVNGDQLIEFIPNQNNKLTEYFYLGGKRVAQRITP